MSEPNAGSDVVSMKTTATKKGNKYVLNGSKMWITNGGFADVFTVFAKVDGQHFTGFIVEKNDSGVSHGNEEHKLGQRGSSTTPIIMQDAKIPKDRLLGEIGKGHLIAFNVLNFGRIKMGAGAIGGGKRVLSQAAKYAAQRQQFGQDSVWRGHFAAIPPTDRGSVFRLLFERQRNTHLERSQRL